MIIQREVKMPTFLIQVLESKAFGSCLPWEATLEESSTWFLAPVWETRLEFLAPGFSLGQLWL